MTAAPPPAGDPHPLRREGLARRAAPFIAAAMVGFVMLVVAQPPDYVSSTEEHVLAGAAVLLAVLTGAAVWFVAWERWPRWTAVIPPLAYILVVALLREAGGGSVSGFGTLALVPVVWVGLYGTRRDLIATLAGVALLFVLPIIVWGAPGYPDSEWRRAILSVSVAGLVGLAIQALVRQVRERAEDARVQAERLDAALARQRRSEADLEAVIRSAAEGIVAFDLLGQVAMVNPAAAAMLGAPADELVGYRPHHVFLNERPELAPEAVPDAPLYRALREGTTTVVSDECFWRRDGSSFPVEFRVTPLTAGDTRTGSLLVFRDVTERRAVEEMKNQFVATVSHELRTPLTSIRGSLGLLAGGVAGDLSDEARQMVSVAVSNSERLIRLVNEILDIERIESGRVELEPRETDARSLVAAAADGVAGMAQRHDVELDAAAEPFPLRVDVDRIVQALTNILGNAIKFSPAGACVTVRTRESDGDVVFSVRDEGRGIPAEKLSSVFERFQQVDATDARDRGGTGLGLAITRSIVEQHGGRVWAESELGRGSTFHITLPSPVRADA